MNKYTDRNEDVTVSVVIPFYKNKEWLYEALNSVDNQTYLPDEVIVVDDGSKEDILDLKLSNIALKVIRQVNKGPAAARNAGIREAMGQYVAFLDSDDIWHPQKIERQLNVMLQTDCMWSYHKYSKFSDKYDSDMFYGDIVFSVDNVFRKVVNSSNIATPCVMVKRKVLLEDDLMFNESVRYGEDGCLWACLAHKYKVAFLDDELCGVRMHGTNAAYVPSIQLKSRATALKFWKEYKFDNDIGFVTRFAAYICFWENKFCELCGIYSLPSRIREFIVGSMYFVPWVLFKIARRLT